MDEYQDAQLDQPNNGDQSGGAFEKLIPPKQKRRKGGRKSLLWHIINDNHEAYLQMLNYIRMGLYLETICSAMGVVPSTMYRWVKQGGNDHAAKKKTVYRKFYSDVIQAVGQARAMKEVQLSTLTAESESALKYWLERGPGRILGDQWRDSPESSLDLNLQGVGAEYVEDDGRAPVGPEVMAEAMGVLEQIGMIRRTPKMLQESTDEE